MQEPLDFAIDAAGIARLTINRPKRANSVDAELADALLSALDWCVTEPKIRLLVLLGAGRVFCAGIDLKWMRASGEGDDETNVTDAMKIVNILHRLNTLPVPTVAAVSGPAIGFGVGLVAACDIAIAVENAVFRFSEVKLGIIPAVISPYVLAAMGSRGARRYFLTGEPFPAAEAARWGLVHQVCALDALGNATAQIVTELLSAKAHAQKGAKVLIEDYRSRPIDQSLMEETARRLADMRRSPETQQTLAELFEK
ncbi:MAG TPA: enoyl-CoA hydratase-related protein [Micropepsaceae bacterium]|nr:enoyl-CoA hydratase-related protein [Micropepsaceae bacterium]